MDLRTAQSIVQNSEAFYEQQYVIDGQNVSIFNYRLAQYNDFVRHNAYEMRGLTFVNGVKHIALHKFFNLNQVESTQYELLKAKPIKSIRVKEDGSMITFVKVNGDIVPKTKMSFKNDQTEMVNQWLSRNPLGEVGIQWFVNNGMTPVFELVSPHNRIVLEYSETNLVLLQVRNSETGKYLDISPNTKDFDYTTLSGTFDIAKFEPMTTLDDLIERAKVEEGLEGWVLEFTDGTFIKIKTDWYFSLHGLLTTDLTREDFILKNIMEETIDDLLGHLAEDDARRDYIGKIQASLNHFLNTKIAEILIILGTFKGERKDLAITYRQHPLFSVIMRAYVSGDIQKAVIERYLKEVNALESARDFLRNELNFNEVKV
jgi:T4 RnlA family RNA ligase